MVLRNSLCTTQNTQKPIQKCSFPELVLLGFQFGTSHLDYQSQCYNGHVNTYYVFIASLTVMRKEAAVELLRER